MKIVVLDGYCLNPGDLSWNEFSLLGNVAVYERTSPSELLSRANGAEVLITNKTLITANDMSLLPTLRYIGVLATGYNVVDIKEAHNRGIIVTNIPAYSTSSVAQMVFAHLLNITQRVGLYSDLNRQGEWTKSADFSYTRTPLIELSGKTMGIVGLGNIGKETARIAIAFGMNVVALTSKTPNAIPDGVKSVSLSDLFKLSDVVSLHCPLTQDTHHIVNASTLALMKPSAILINTGRGPLVDEVALADALNNHRLFAAGLDVLSSEPPMQDNPLLTALNCYITPHIAWATIEARTRLMRIAFDNLRAFIKGDPQNIV